MKSYDHIRDQLTRVLEAGTFEDETMFRLRVSGEERSDNLGITPDQLEAVIRLLSFRREPEHCPNGPHLVCADYNKMSQRMWHRNRQTWNCEGCGEPMARTFDRGDGWSAWEKVNS